MKKKLGMAVLLVLLLTGCAQTELYSENPVTLEPAAAAYYEEMGITEDVRAEAEAVYQTYTLRGEREVQIRLPEYWEDIYVISDSEGNLTVCEKYNNSLDACIGNLWSIMVLTHEEFPQYFYVEGDAYTHILGANIAVIGEDDTYVYVMQCPTDVQFNYPEEKAQVLYEAAWDTRDQFISDFLEINDITVNEKAPVLN